MPNDVFADWSVHPVAPAELPRQILFPPKSLKRPLLPLLGQLSVAHTETFYARNVKPSGGRRSSLSALHFVVCGSRSTPSWVVDMCRCRRPSMHQNFVNSTRRSPESVRPPQTLHRRVMSPHHHTANFRLSASSPMMTSSLPSANLRTSSAPQTHFQLIF